MVLIPPCAGGNKARGVLAESLIVKTAGSIRERLAGRHIGDPLTHGEGLRLHGVTRLGAWPLRGIPCEGLQRGLGEACVLLDTSVKILESSTGICISLPYYLASVFILQSWCVLYFPSLVIR